MSKAPEIDAARCGLCGGSGVPWLEKHGYPVLLCSRCHNGFVPESLVPSDLESLYGKEYFEGGQDTGYPSYLADRKFVEGNFRERVRYIDSLGPPGKRLLDVGTAFGLFLKVALEGGYDASGIEVAPDCAMEAARLSGASVACGDFVKTDLVGPFDVITMFDVIEHFRDPKGAVERACQLLSPRGILLVETGDIATPVARALGKHWWFIDPPQHLFYFSRDGFVELAKQCGFAGEIIVKRPTRSVSFTNIAFKLAGTSPKGPLRDVMTRVSQAGLPGAVPLNFGDGILAAARKS
jgi:SAM-dependent methyltransferase